MILLAQGFAAEAAEVKVIAAAPISAVFKELGPQFERDTGHKLVTKFASTPVVKREIDAGETFDLAISITSAIDDWIREGKIVAGTRAAVAYAGVGVAVRAGDPSPISVRSRRPSVRCSMRNQLPNEGVLQRDKKLSCNRKPETKGAWRRGQHVSL